MLLQLIRCELLKLSRVPAFTIPTLLFPILFFALFGLAQPQGAIGGVPVSVYLLASFASFSVMSTALFSFGVPIATERRDGWILMLRTTPIPPVVYLLAKLIVAMLFSVAAITLLVLFARLTARGVPDHLLWSLPVRMLAGVLPFSALGMTLGLTCTPGAASAVANAIFLPLAFASGLFVPLERLPAVFSDIAPWLPSYHLGVLGWSIVGSHPQSSTLASAAVLAAFTVVFMLLGLWAYRRDGRSGRR